jgi:DNA-binding PadR family transcriptional regulator
MTKGDRRREKFERAMARGHGAFGHGPMFGPPFGGGRGRKRRGDVRAALLLALEEEPRNGYQLMQLIEERSGGRWRPSPGSVYPALAQLEDQGLIRSVDRDGQKLYELTDAGREHLAEHPQHPAPWDEDDDDDPAAQSIVGMRKLIGQVAAAAMQVSQVADERQLQRASEVLVDTRRKLYRILAEDDAPEADA